MLAGVCFLYGSNSLLKLAKKAVFLPMNRTRSASFVLLESFDLATMMSALLMLTGN
jgi:hypothetical protein